MVKFEEIRVIASQAYLDKKLYTHAHTNEEELSMFLQENWTNEEVCLSPMDMMELIEGHAIDIANMLMDSGVDIGAVSGSGEEMTLKSIFSGKKEALTDKCKCSRIATVWGKTSDCCVFEVEQKEVDGYVPEDVGIGGGDSIEFDYCLDCGKIQSNKFPIPQEIVDGVLENG